MRAQAEVAIAEEVAGASGSHGGVGQEAHEGRYERDLVRLIYAASDLSALATRLLTTKAPSTEAANVVGATADFAEASASFLRRAGRGHPKR